MLELWKYNEATHQKVKLKKNFKVQVKTWSYQVRNNVVRLDRLGMRLDSAS
jgi:hypothetical protein